MKSSFPITEKAILWGATRQVATRFQVEVIQHEVILKVQVEDAKLDHPLVQMLPKSMANLMRSYSTHEEMRDGLLWGIENFQEGSKLKDGGRLGMQSALLVVTEFAQAHLPPADRQLLEPLRCLYRALHDLEKGSVHPALAHRTVRNRKRASWDVADFKGRCLAAADLLFKHGSLARGDADLTIFRRVELPARRLGVRMSDKTLQTWRRDARKAIDHRGWPTTQFGFWTWAMRQWAEIDNPNAPLGDRIEKLLEPFSEQRLSYLPLPVA